MGLRSVWEKDALAKIDESDDNMYLRDVVSNIQSFQMLQKQTLFKTFPNLSRTIIF